MVLSEQAVRNWRVATYVCTLGTVFWTTFYTSYDGMLENHPRGGANKKHVLTDLQQSYRQFVDQYFWGIPPSNNNTFLENDTTVTKNNNNTYNKEKSKR
mmetsp:Transcript_41073/g.46669  ORF Transcript_41073/g.46669 Transcript_41073/m.46669 type:complete len:99 (-) Transcript_41073:33-329(-)